MTIPPALAALAFVLAASLQYEPQILHLQFEGEPSVEAEIATTSRETCETAVRAIAGGLWQLSEGKVSQAWCERRNGFAPGSEFIRGFNDRGRR